MAERRALCFFLKAALVAISLSGAASAESLLRTRLNSDIASTNPGVIRDENTDAVLMHMVEGLVAYREDASVGPLLARDWSLSADERVYTFRLRPGLRFHNGAPVTSADVVWSFRRYLDPATHWRCLNEFTGGGFARITAVRAIDPLTVRIGLDRASPNFLSTLARVDCGETAILHRSSVAADGAWLKPVGTGPFRFVSWRRNQVVELARFAGYRPLAGPRDGNTGGKHALVDRVRFLVIPDVVSAEAALLRGDLDILDNVLPLDARQLKVRRDIRLSVAPASDVFALLFQTRDRRMADPRLRQAIALTLDVPGLVNAVTEGASRPNRSIVPAPSSYHVGVQAAMPRPNIALARRLAAAAGYRGEPIRLITNHRYPELFDAAILAQAMALEAGINVQIDTLDWAAQLDRYYSGNYQAMMFAYSARMDPALSYEAFIGDKKADPRKVWDDPVARALLDRSRATGDPAQRQAVFDQLHARFLQQVPAVILFNQGHIAAVRANVIGYKGWPAAQLRLWGVALR
ncbi:MAG: putative transporter substrate-binding protein [Sphingomonas bacterium]|uniref:ABC transporter substrate-binding protein n=1 Tax=Sphingomonas bacterium TaxID=1895847 RepID=UPI002608DB73|nr:ABC transporter substrate-binding protein [Sphingomonas bacterium]MDB5707204.1 putative transporter substrate-binding protein [Sphingomonas bacterium]